MLQKLDMKMLTPFVSVIIPVYGKIEGLVQTLSALQEQSYPSACYEVVVIDNGTFSGLDNIMLTQQNITLVNELTPGSYSARNSGLRHARGEIVAFTDSDCIPHRTWIENGVRTIQKSNEIGLVAGRVDVFFASPGKPTATELYDSLVSFPQKLTIERYHYGATANLFTTRNVLRKVGLFNCNHFSGGDCEWGRRVYESGFKQEYCESVMVQHPARQSFGDLIQKSRRVTIGTMRSLADDDGNTLLLSSWYYHLVRRPGNLWSLMSRYHDSLGGSIKIRVIGIYYTVKLLQLVERVRVGVLSGKPQR